jgi:hypothetical protein
MVFLARTEPNWASCSAEQVREAMDDGSDSERDREREEESYRRSR